MMPRSPRAGPVGRFVPISLLFAACAATLVLALWRPGATAGFWGAVEGATLDARFVLRGPVDPPDGVAILVIDDADIAINGTFPPTRDTIAAAVDAATSAGAAAVALDLLMIEPSTSDPVLADALARNGRAVIATAQAPLMSDAPAPPHPSPVQQAAVRRSGFAVVAGQPQGTADMPVLLPTDRLSDTARLGNVGVSLDSDGGLRRMPAAMPVRLPDTGETIQLPVLALAALDTAQTLPSGTRTASILRAPDHGVGGTVAIGGLKALLDPAGALPLVYYGGAGSFPTWPLREAATADLHGKVVFVGASALGFGDFHRSPFDAALPGVEAHATLAANLLEGRHLRRDGIVWLVDIFAAIAIAGLAFAATSRERPRRAVLLSGLVAVATLCWIHGGFLAGWWFDAVTLIGACIAGTLAGFWLRVLRDRRQIANLALFQSPALAVALAQQGRPAFDGRVINCATVFVDVSGFTTLSERLETEQTGTVMAEFQTIVDAVAGESDGIVTQYSGDGAMVVFGLGEPGPELAAQQALAFLEQIFAAAARISVPDGSVLGLRAGAHLGPVQARVMGGARHRHVSVAGDAVNVASRVQGEAQKTGAALALSGPLLSASGDPQRWCARLHLVHATAPVLLRGRRAPLELWYGRAGPLLGG